MKRTLATILLGITLVATPRISNAKSLNHQPRLEFVGGYNVSEKALFIGLDGEIPLFSKEVKLTGGIRAGKSLRQSKGIDVSVYPKAYGGTYKQYSGTLDYINGYKIGLETGVKYRFFKDFFASVTGGMAWHFGDVASDINLQHCYLDGTPVGDQVNYSMKSRINDLTPTYGGTLSWQQGEWSFGISANRGPKLEYSLNPERPEHKGKLFEGYEFSVSVGHAF